MAQVNVLKAALQGEWEAITTLYRERPTLCDAAPVTAVTGNTLIHIAVQSGRAEVVSELLDLLPERVRVAKNNGGNTSLHEAAGTGNTEIATVILKKDEGLITSRNSCGETPVFCAAMYGKKEMLNFLVSVAKKVVHEVMVRRNDGATILHAATLGEFYDVALEILELCPEMAFSRDERGMTALHLLAFSSSSFKSRTIFSLHSVGGAPFLIYEKIAVALYACIPVEHFSIRDYSTPLSGSNQADTQEFSFTKICKGYVNSGIKHLLSAFPVLRNVYIAKQKHTWALQLVKRLIEKEAQWRYEHDGMGPNKSYGCNRINDDGDESKKMKNKNIKKKLDRPLILATKFGIVELVREIVKVFPESVEFVDEAGKNLLHLAVEHRQEYVLELLNKMRIATAVMAAGIDIGGNTILHLAAKLGEYKPKHVRGPFIHMQWESIWFERVKKLCPAHLVPYRNRSNLTAKQVFTQSHRSLLKQGEEWLKDASNTCIVVSTLIATITFAATFTIPGGNDSETGLPVLRRHPNFVPFIEYVAVSLLFSLLSLAMFISIYASPFEEEDFLAWLPIQCFVAVTALFNSVVFTVSSFMIAFLLVTDWNLPKPVSIADIVLASVGFSCFCPVYLEIVYIPICYTIDLLLICI